MNISKPTNSFPVGSVVRWKDHTGFVGTVVDEPARLDGGYEFFQNAVKLADGRILGARTYELELVAQ